MDVEGNFGVYFARIWKRYLLKRDFPHVST